MEWEEISRRLRNGTSVSVLAELAGTTYKNMYNRIRRREQLDGKQYLKADQLKRPYKAQGGRKKAASVPEVEPIGEEKAPARPDFLEKQLHVPEVVKDFAGIPEGVVKETLEGYRESHAAAVKQMHDIEDMYKEAKHTEMKIRAICVALERLLEGGSL